MFHWWFEDGAGMCWERGHPIPKGTTSILATWKNRIQTRISIVVVVVVTPETTKFVHHVFQRQLAALHLPRLRPRALVRSPGNHWVFRVPTDDPQASEFLPTHGDSNFIFCSRGCWRARCWDFDMMILIIYVDVKWSECRLVVPIDTSQLPSGWKDMVSLSKVSHL